jgi:glycosyltransferase involved in cell wall biosynthesis
LRQQAQRLGVSEHVTIAGFPPDDQRGMVALMAQADLVTLLSEHEAQGITAVEALALGRPTLVADTTALRELAQRGLARSVAIEAPPRQVAEAMLAQLRDPLIPQPIHFPTWEQCADDLLMIYQQASHAHCAR